jgi:SAM-dependent methyltransferase
MTTQDQALDQAAVEAFGGRVLEVFNGASLAIMLSIGHRTDLFDIMATLPPATSEQIAAAAGLNERYVREWLGAMTTGRIVAYDPTTRTYRLPPEHATFLTRAAGPNNFACFMQSVGMMAQVEDDVVACFRDGGGVPYSRFPQFQRLMAEVSGEIHDARLIDTILPLVPGLVERLRTGIEVADVACGMGHAVNLMARAFPGSRFTGYDFSEEGIAAGRAEAAAWGLTNARFELKDVATLDAESGFDAITVFDGIHDQAQPRRVLANIARALRPSGTFLMVDVAASSNLEENLDHPMATALYTGSTLHCMTVSLAQGGEGLGTMWGEQKARQLLAEAGFVVQDVARVEGDIGNNYYLCRKA